MDHSCAKHWRDRAAIRRRHPIDQQQCKSHKQAAKKHYQTLRTIWYEAKRKANVYISPLIAKQKISYLLYFFHLI